MGHGGAPRDTPVQHGLHYYLSFEHPDYEPERCGGLVVQWQATPLETLVGQQHSPVDLDGEVSILAHICPKVRVHKLGGSFVHLAGCFSNESDPVHTFRHQAHGIRLGFRNCQSKRSAHCSDIGHHLRKAL